MPLFSVIIPTYNREALIRETIASVQNQTFTDWQCIVVDDGSEDATKEVVQMICQQDSRVKYVYQKNAERSAARNKGIQNAEGEYICFLDSDDRFLPNHLKLLKDELERRNYPVALLFTDYICNNGKSDYNETIPRLRESDNQLLFMLQNAIIPARVCVHRIILAGEKFDEDITVVEDNLLWTRIADKHPIIQVNEATVIYAVHDNNSIRLKNNPGLKRWNGLNLFFKRYPKITKQIPERLKKEILSDALFSIAKHYIYVNDRTQSLLFLVRSVLINPIHYQLKHKIYLILQLLLGKKIEQYSE